VTLHQHFKFHFQHLEMQFIHILEHTHGHVLLACHRYLSFALVQVVLVIHHGQDPMAVVVVV
jgi:hypothetical protein